jgi:hypothetical protein
LYVDNIGIAADKPADVAFVQNALRDRFEMADFF